MNSAPGELNRSRDLYVAFAFAAADLLVEVDEEGCVLFAVGAAMALAGKPARKLTGMPLADIFIAADSERVERALTRIDRGERVRHLLLHAPGGQGNPNKPVALAGFQHPHRAHARLVALTHASALDFPQDHRDPVTGLLGKDDFADMARRMMSESSSLGEGEEAYRLTLLAVPQIDKVRAEAGPLAADEFMAELGDRLKSVSVGGDAAGELGDNRYGVIHAAKVDTTAIENTISELMAEFLPNGAGEKVNATSVELDAGDISPEEAANALLYTLHRFSQSGEVQLDNLADDLRPRLSATVEQMRGIKQVIEGGEFQLVFQPIVDLWNDVVHHFECLVRFPGRDSPFETVTFAENVGIVGALDMAIVKRAIAFIRSAAGNHEALRFAVNLSGRSLSHPATAKQLLDMLDNARELRGRLLFELTESAEVDDLPTVNGILQALRRMGFPVCLDDFGAGAAAFHYLRALQVDHVKIDGSYVKDVTANGAAMPFLRSITSLCNELKIGTIAEFIETQEAASLLKVLKVRFGQGYLYGKPMQPRPDPVHPLRGWAGDRLAWQRGLLVFRSPKPTPAAEA